MDYSAWCNISPRTKDFFFQTILLQGTKSKYVDVQLNIFVNFIPKFESDVKCTPGVN